MASARWIRGCLLGEGSFGRVNLAISIDSGELLAVKSVNCSDCCSKEVLAMENELNILQSLDSNRIVKCLGSDYTVENGIPMRNLFMEYMAGGSLRDLMQKVDVDGRLSEAVVSSCTRSVLEGLEYLHGNGIVHCDIKGANILVSAAGDVKLADFGSANRSATLGLQLKGTPLWMAPEVILQQEQGPASDIWSLGCTIVELLTGRPPWNFDGTNIFDALLQIGQGRTEPISLPECISDDCTDFILKCLDRNPQARWSSTQLLQHPFVLIGKDESTSARKEDIHKVPMSPTSVCDFAAVTDDWQLASPSPCVLQPGDDGSSCQHIGNSLTVETASENFKSQVHWVTVRGSQSSVRQMPLSNFMMQSRAEAKGESGTAADVGRTPVLDGENKENGVKQRRRRERKDTRPFPVLEGGAMTVIGSGAEADFGGVERFVSAVRARSREQGNCGPVSGHVKQ